MFAVTPPSETVASPENARTFSPESVKSPPLIDSDATVTSFASVMSQALVNAASAPSVHATALFDSSSQFTVVSSHVPVAPPF